MKNIALLLIIFSTNVQAQTCLNRLAKYDTFGKILKNYIESSNDGAYDKQELLLRSYLNFQNDKKRQELAKLVNFYLGEAIGETLEEPITAQKSKISKFLKQQIVKSSCEKDKRAFCSNYKDAKLCEERLKCFDRTSQFEFLIKNINENKVLSIEDKPLKKLSEKEACKILED